MSIGGKRHRIIFEKLDESTETWNYYYECFSKVNVAGGSEYLIGGAEQSKSITLFEVWYCEKLKELQFDTQCYRIKFRGAIFDIQPPVDNYMFRNVSLKIKAVGRLER
ncbi:MAG: head-tail adaptor protein [Bacteroidota bacterium]|nr:head-tail adaptor protein [Bacteroidota bacterium]